MRARSGALGIAAAVFLTACTTVPTGPSVMALPGTGKTFEQFQADDGVCRQSAQQASGSVQGRYDMTYLQCMYAKGHQIPAAGGYRQGPSAPGPP